MNTTATNTHIFLCNSKRPFFMYCTPEMTPYCRPEAYLCKPEVYICKPEVTLN